MRWANRLPSAGRSTGPVWLVLHLSPKKRGSGEQQLEALAARLRARGTPLAYAFAGPPAPWLGRRLDELGVPVRVLDFARPARAAGELLAAWARERPALVHLHFVRAFSPLVAAARATGARVILNDHMVLGGGTPGLLRSALKRVRDACVLPLFDVRIAVSECVAASVARAEHVPRAKIRVIENGVDVARFAGASGAGVREELGVGDRPLVVSVSRLWPEKGGETAIRALPLVEGAVLALVGDGPMEAAWRALAASLGVADRVRFLGLRDDVERLVAASDVALVPSEGEEAFGQAVAEAMAAGKPVVVTRSGAMPDVVGEAGLVVPRRDPIALAAAVRRLLDDPPLARRLGELGRRRARERYDLPRWLDRTVALYDALLSADPATNSLNERSLSNS